MTLRNRLKRLEELSERFEDHLRRQELEAIREQHNRIMQDDFARSQLLDVLEQLYSDPSRRREPTDHERATLAEILK